MPNAAWLLLCHHPNDTYAEVIVTDHPDGPWGHVPEGEEPEPWLCAEVFGFDWEPGTDIEVRAWGADWTPQVWTTDVPAETPEVSVTPTRSRRP